MTLTKEEIIKQLRLATEEFTNYTSQIDSVLFFRQPKEKWSIAQNVDHLTISANTTKLAYGLPKFILRLYTGKPNRPSRSYDELVNKYKLKLQQGGTASGRFIPKIISPQTGKENLLQSFTTSMTKLSNAIEKKWSDPLLDQYIAPHPLLGKITLRELGYFTIYHTQHHLSIIKERISENSTGSR
jgi:DinB superfamily